MITLVYRRALDDVWQEAARALRARLLKALGPEVCSELHIVGRSRKQKVCIDADHVFERMEVAGRSYQYMQVRLNNNQYDLRVWYSTLLVTKQLSSHQNAWKLAGAVAEIKQAADVGL
jgi:tRNA (uracil-5-)-methyltransferase